MICFITELEEKESIILIITNNDHTLNIDYILYVITIYNILYTKALWANQLVYVHLCDLFKNPIK